MMANKMDAISENIENLREKVCSLCKKVESSQPIRGHGEEIDGRR
jgi:hypothetical protein